MLCLSCFEHILRVKSYSVKRLIKDVQNKWIMSCVCVCVDGLGVKGSEWLAEERQGRLEQVDSGTESADDRYENITISHFLLKPYCIVIF